MIPDEVGLFGVTVRADANVRQQLLLQNVFGMADTLSTRQTRLALTATSDEIARLLAC